MSTLDWFIVGATLLFAVNGYLRGFIVGALSLAGFVAGAIVGTRVAAALLPAGDASPYTPVFGLLGAVSAGAILATGMTSLGTRLRRALRFPFLGVVDGVAGAALSGAVALGIAWLLGVIVLSLPDTGSWRSEVARSVILRRLDELMPPSGVVLNTLARIDPLPALGVPGGPVAAPPGVAAQTPALSRAAQSVVRVVGTACGLGIEGSGWVAAPDLVVTNAHVVAGEHDTVVEAGGLAGEVSATVVVFDPRHDIAILRVAGLDLPALHLVGDPAAGSSGVIFGYPLDGPFDAQPARIGATEEIRAPDAYGRGPVSRLLTTVRGLIRPGNSGGPVLDRAGSVLTTVFAADTGGGPSGGYGVANVTVAAELAASGGGPVSTQGCT